MFYQRVDMAQAQSKKKPDAKKAEAKQESQAKKAAAGKPTQERHGGPAKYAIAIIIVVVIIGFAIFAGNYAMQNTNSSFNTFKANFDSAPRVAIFVTAYNGTVLSGTVGCATAIIEEIASSKTNHRNTSTIDFNIINQTSCIQSPGLTENNSNYRTTTLQNCLNITKTEPTIYINYSSTNSTVIKPDYLYVSGTGLFLSECGVASEIS
jgi:uncharacterized integral membrane protein